MWNVVFAGKLCKSKRKNSPNTSNIGHSATWSRDQTTNRNWERPHWFLRPTVTSTPTATSHVPHQLRGWNLFCQSHQWRAQFSANEYLQLPDSGGTEHLTNNDPAVHKSCCLNKTISLFASKTLRWHREVWDYLPEISRVGHNPLLLSKSKY